MTLSEQGLIEVMLLLVELFLIGLNCTSPRFFLPVGLRGKINIYAILFSIRREKVGD